MSLLKYYTADNRLGNVSDVWSALLGQEFNLGSTHASAPKVNVRELEESFVLEVEAPGRNKEDFKLTLEEGLLKVAFEAKEQEASEKEGYRLREFRAASFSRSFRLPKNVDPESLEASYADGILEINLPKVEEKQPRQFMVK